MGKRSKSSDRWLRRQRRDTFAQRARSTGQVSRAHYKLAEIDNKLSLVHRGQAVLELGAAPGGWTHYLEERLGDEGLLVACDPRPLTHGPTTHYIAGEYGDSVVDQEIEARLTGRRLDLVLSDMAPNISGIKVADQARAMGLAELASDAALRWLKPGGGLLVKLFQGAGVDAWLAGLRRHFKKVKLIKPASSRPESREVYAVALTFSGVS